MMQRLSPAPMARAAVFAGLLAAALAGATAAEMDHGHGDHGDHPDPHDEETTRFTIADFERHGVTLATAGPGSVDVAFELPGEVRPNADRIAHLAPRFPGLVREVRKNIGDEVRAGEVLARIESDNLTSYDLVAGFSGIVIDKHIAAGEAVSRDTEAFIVADLSTVWVEIHVYQKALARVRVGQSVSLDSDDASVRTDGVISYITPVIDQATRTATARVVVDNRDGRWRPGLFIVATVVQPVEAEVIVRRRALHTLDDHSVVFAEENGSFEAKQVVTGALGREWVEIASGLEAGRRYADEGSFLVKAELAKSAAGHDH